MAFKKKAYSIQVIIIVSIFCFVLFNLVFKLILDMRSESVRKKAEQIEKDRLKHEFIVNVDKRYETLLKLFETKEYDKAIKIIKTFNKYGKSDYKNLPAIKKEIRLSALKKKLEFIPKIHLDEFMQLSQDIEITKDDSTEVFIRTPRYGQYFYTSDFPITLEGIALSVSGDFSNALVWDSDIDGQLGIGKKINIILSIGAHEITATGTNGTTKGFMKTKIFIEKDPAFLKKYSNKE